MGVSSCGTFLISSIIYGEDSLNPMNGFGSLLAIPGMKSWGDIDDVVAGLAPRPFFETAGDMDRHFEKAEERYKNSGVEERYKTIFYDVGEHIFREDMRQKSYKWFDKWL